MIRVLADYHHRDLLFSLHLLFEKRLGFELYRPIGEDWLTRGFWKIGEVYGNPPDTVHQYLALECDRHTANDAQYGCINAAWKREGIGYRVYDPTHGHHERAVTYEQFMAHPFDIVISSIPAHDLPFARLAASHPSKPRVVAQMGNWQQDTMLRNVMFNCPWVPRQWQNAVHYHQEIDPALFFYQPPLSASHITSRIISCVNLLPHREIYDAYRAAMSDATTFHAFGASSPDGSLPGAVGVAPIQRAANLGWHIKPHDGFGHTAMGWLSQGRPIITRMQEIAEYGWDAPKMWIDGETCIAIDGLSVEDGVKKIRRALEPEENLRMAERTRDRFRELVNYDEEFVRLKAFVERVLNESRESI